MGVKPGLEGIVAAETEISLVDGEGGRLIYRGYRVEDLANNHIPEEVANLLWKGSLPDVSEREAIRHKWAKGRVLPGFLKDLIATIPREVEMTDVIRTAISALGGRFLRWAIHGGTGDFHRLHAALDHRLPPLSSRRFRGAGTPVRSLSRRSLFISSAGEGSQSRPCSGLGGLLRSDGGTRNECLHFYCTGGYVYPV